MIMQFLSRAYSPVQKVITLRDLQKVFSHVEHWSIERCFMLKHNIIIHNDEDKWGKLFPILIIQEQFSLSVIKALMFVCTVIRTV